MTKRIRVKAGKYGYGAHVLEDHVVEIRKVPQDDILGSFTLSEYKIFLDDQEIGTVRSARERQSANIKGTRIRKDGGNPIRWRYSVALRSHGPHIRSYDYETRTRAVANAATDALELLERAKIWERSGKRRFRERWPEIENAKYGTKEYRTREAFDREVFSG